MQAEANQGSPAPATTGADELEIQTQSSWLRTFALVAVVTLVLLGGLGLAVYFMSSGDNLPMNYPGFDNK